ARAPQPEPGARRHLLGRLRAGAVVCVATAAVLRIPPHAGARPLPVRRVDLPRTRPECRLGADRRACGHRRRTAARTSGPPAARTALTASRTSSPRRDAGASSFWATL